MEIYFRTNGSICLYKFFELKKEKSILTAIHLINKAGNIEQVFETEESLLTHWIRTLLDPDLDNFLIVDREAVYYKPLLQISQENVFKICMIHSKHFNKSTGKFNSEIYKTICEDFVRLINEPSKPDAVVVLTNRQKQDMEQQFGTQDHLFVIPNCMGKRIQKVNYQNRTPLQAICLAGYSPEKQHSSLIKVFAQVIRTYPSARLDLYGSGNERVEILGKIQELGLSGNIFANDYADNVEKIYDSAVLGLLTSRLEGFPLFLLESISHGCPCISYDIDYGPSDLIEEGINGYLIEFNNEEDMACKICSLFADVEKLQEMSEASYKKAEEFQADVVAEKWRSLLDKIVERRLEKQQAR
jgi:poly(glycerol-phosphate) alpha-glucosyltransferase